MKKKVSRAAMGEQLPQDILFYEVFPKLPIKSLLRFRCVCKSLYSLLTKPEFARLHLNHIIKHNTNTNTHQKLLIVSFPTKPCERSRFQILDYESHHNGRVPLQDFPFQSSGVVSILGSSHGLVSLGIIHPEARKYGINYTDLVLWNPLTGDYKKLEMFGSSKCKLSNAFGFCYDTSVDDYKVVCVSCEGVAYLYTLKSRSWREVVNVEAKHDCYCSLKSGTIAYGALHWILQFRGVYSLVRFDLKNEEFTKMPLPNDGRRGLHRYLKVFQGCLYLFISYYGMSLNTIGLWRMDESKNQVWVKMTTISHPYDEFSRFPLCFLIEEEKVLICVQRLHKDQQENFTYDLRNHKIEKFWVDGIRDFSNQITYFETFFSPSR